MKTPYAKTKGVLAVKTKAFIAKKKKSLMAFVKTNGVGECGAVTFYQRKNNKIS